MKKTLFSLLGATVFGLGLSADTWAATITGQDVNQGVPNLLVVKIPAENGITPTAETMTSQKRVEIMMLNVNDSSAVDKDGRMDMSQFTQLIDQEIAVAQSQSDQSQTVVLQASPTVVPSAPDQVQNLFQRVNAQGGSRSFELNPYWYYYNSYRPHYGVYGYGYNPYYGYYGSPTYYPNYGVYYNGYTYPYASVGNPYWYGGYYYYPYYHRW